MVATGIYQCFVATCTAIKEAITVVCTTIWKCLSAIGRSVDGAPPFCSCTCGLTNVIICPHYPRSAIKKGCECLCGAIAACVKGFCNALAVCRKAIINGYASCLVHNSGATAVVHSVL